MTNFDQSDPRQRKASAGLWNHCQGPRTQGHWRVEVDIILVLALLLNTKQELLSVPAFQNSSGAQLKPMGMGMAGANTKARFDVCPVI